MRQFLTSALKKFNAALFILALIGVLLLLLLSNGRILDLSIGISKQNPILVVISSASWAILAIAAWRLTVGRWRKYREVQRATLMVIFMAPSIMIIHALFPAALAASHWSVAILGGVAAIAAYLIADWIVPPTPNVSGE